MKGVLMDIPFSYKGEKNKDASQRDRLKSVGVVFERLFENCY